MFAYQFSGSYAWDTSLQKDVVLVSDDRACLTAAVDEVGLDAGTCAFLKSVCADRVKEATDVPSSVEVYVQGAPLPAPPRRVVLALLPTAASRHNTPSRAHAVGAVVKAHKGKKDVIIVLAPSNDEYLYAQSLAVARQFPMYTASSSSGAKGATGPAAAEQMVDVVLRPMTTTFAAANATLLLDVANVSRGIRLACRLVDTPPNLLHADAYVEECRRVAEKLGAGCVITVIQGRDLEAQGFGGLWGVGKASEQLPALVVLSHVPAGAAGDKSVCLVGKGIVYDTGGLSIKTPTTSMAGMKTDMGGSAAVLGAFEAAVKSGVKGPYHALLCIAENSVGPASTRPDDVHVMLSGKTVEINNTDAEGRLVLSDGVFYAYKKLNPKVIIDIATLTGAQLVATGKNHAAIYCNDDALEATAIAAGKASGDLVFPVPYCPEFYRKEYKSEVADMKNSVADRGNAQVSCAAQFIGNHLEAFLAEGGRWLHVDMAGPCGEARATGYGVALLFDLLKRL